MMQVFMFVLESLNCLVDKECEKLKKLAMRYLMLSEMLRKSFCLEYFMYKFM